MSEKITTKQCHLFILSHIDQRDIEQMNNYIQNFCMSMKQRGFTNNEIYVASNLNNLVHSKYIGGSVDNADEYVSVVLSGDIPSCQEYYKKYDTSTVYCYACKYSDCYCNKNIMNEKKILGYAFRDKNCALEFKNLNIDTAAFKSVFITDNYNIDHIYPVYLNQMLAELCMEYWETEDLSLVYESIAKQYDRECAEDISKYIPSYIKKMIQLSKNINIAEIKKISAKLNGTSPALKQKKENNSSSNSKKKKKTKNAEMDMAKLLFGIEFVKADDNENLVKSTDAGSVSNLEQQCEKQEITNMENESIKVDSAENIPDEVYSELVENTLSTYGIQGFVKKEIEGEDKNIAHEKVFNEKSTTESADIHKVVNNNEETNIKDKDFDDHIVKAVPKQEVSPTNLEIKSTVTIKKDKSEDLFFIPEHLLEQKDIDTNIMLIHGSTSSERDLLENSILNEGCLILDVFFDMKREPYLCIYLNSINRFIAFKKSDKQCINILGPYINRKRFKVICFSVFPILAECSKIGLKPRNVYSIMTMYGIIKGNSGIKKVDDIISNIVQVENIYHKPFILYAMPYYLQMYNILQNEIDSFTEARMNIYMEAELAIGASYYLRNIVNTEKPLLCINNCNDYQYYYNETIFSGKAKGYYVTILFHLDNNKTVNGLELMYTLIGYYSERGYFRKCPIHILGVFKNKLIYHVDTKTDYDYTFDMFCYLSELIAGRVFDSGCSIHFSYKML